MEAARRVSRKIVITIVQLIGWQSMLHGKEHTRHLSHNSNSLDIEHT